MIETIETKEIIKNDGTAEAPAEPFKIRKRIGNTDYEVEVRFNPSSRETLDEKILRLVRGEAMKDHGKTS